MKREAAEQNKKQKNVLSIKSAPVLNHPPVNGETFFPISREQSLLFPQHLEKKLGNSSPTIFFFPPVFTAESRRR